MKMNWKIVAAVVALVLLIGLFVGVYFATKPEAQQGGKAFTVIVVHKDGSQKTFQYRTEAEYLGEVLLAEVLIQGYEGQYGLVMEKVDGESAIWEVDNAYWALYVGDALSEWGIDTTLVEDGATYKLIYEAIG